MSSCRVGAVGLTRQGSQVHGYGHSGSQGLTRQNAGAESLARDGGDVGREGLARSQGLARNDGHGRSLRARRVRLSGSGGHIPGHGHPRSEGVSGHDARGEGLTGCWSYVRRNGLSGCQSSTWHEAGDGVAATRGGVRSVRLAWSGSQVERDCNSGSQRLSRSDSWREGLTRSRGDVGRQGLARSQGLTGHDARGGVRGIRLTWSRGQIRRHGHAGGKSVSGLDPRSEGLTRNRGDVGRQSPARCQGLTRHDSRDRVVCGIRGVRLTRGRS